ncbi:unnamed protein product [Schistosoma curassoni]|nr:unnamed protein product [Schistosoma curassoni]
MQTLIGKIHTNCIYIILLILLYDVQNGLTQLNPYFQFIPQNDNLHTKIYDYSKGFDEDHFTYELQYPIPIYETLIKKITIRKNGLLALDSISDDNLPSHYPVNTSITNQRLQDFDGRYLSIFSSVNDGKCGRISVTEIDLLSPSKLPCVERMQIDRLIKFIHLSYIEESELKAQYIVHILWENMTNAYLINQKANTYGMIIISNGIRSYAFMQYIKIEWNENDVAENLALPPESGIFMRPFGGYQLPRSSQAVEPNIWLTETNIALHGEWLVPLYKSENIAKINVKNLSAVASEFVTSLTSVCEGSLHSHKSNNETPSDTVVIKNVNIDNTSEEPIARTQSFKRALESFDNYDLNVSSNDYSYGMTENVPKAAWNILRDETEFSGVDPIDENEVNILPENETGDNFYHESNQFVVDNKEYTPTDRITTQTYYPLGRYDGDEERQEIHEPLIVPVTIHPLRDDDDGEEDITDNKGEYKSVNETFSNSLVKCDAVSECNSHNTECYRVDNSACCVCSDGFYGAGDAKCWSEVNDHKFSFSGSLTTRFGIENTSSPLLIYLDIQHGSLRRSSSGIRGGRTNDRIYSTMRLITPVFHILNSMVSSPCENIPKRERVYNLFTLGNGLQRPFKVLFQFDIERVGKFTIQAVLQLHDFTTGAYASGVIQLEAFSTESLNLLDQSYIEAYSASDKPDKTYYANYKIDDHGRVVFPEQTVKFIVEHRDSNEISNFPEEINVRWSAVAESESCLLKQVSSIPRDKSYYIRLKDRGYCSEDCSSPDGTCNLFCVDEPLLLATEPSPCDCVTCDRHGEVCRPEGASYRCECGQGLKLMPDNTCQEATSLVDVTNYLGVQCGSVNCHTHARCIDPNQAFCQCLPGYRGDGVSHCESDPCSKCRRNEICENGVCIASGVDLCEGIQCGEQAFCQDGACVCTPGYTGDPVVKCYEERDPCSHVQCHYDATCHNGVCTCKDGYIGDGYRECRPRETDPCSNVQCHPNGYCRNGRCLCLNGYEGDGYYECRPVHNDQCQNIRCHEFANCQNGRCQCNAGYEGDGYWECKSIKSDLCKYVRCHENAKCNEHGKCQCLDGYSGDGYYECQKSSQELCAGVQCHRFGQCYENRCYCSHGYVGDGVNFCDAHANDPCDGVRCAANGRCQDGRCVCDPGYTGDGYNECREAEGVKLCGNVQCHQYATCDRGQCRCVTGYDGDGYSDCRPVTEDKCSRVRCHPDAQCTDGYCFCPAGFEGDGYYECKRITQDRCANVRCHENAKCDDGYCRCKEGFEGDGYSECRRKSEDRDPCARIRCHPQAQCEYGFCRCKNGYKGDGYWNCQPIQSDLCRAEQCHQFARCVEGQCRCLDGYEGDGYQMCNIIPGATSADCGNCNGIPFKEIAQCVGGRCVCARGFIEVQAGVCMECVQDNCHQDAACRPDDRFNGAYSCHCKAGFTGDGVSVCKPESVGREDTTSSHAFDPTCGGGCRIRNAECDRYTGTCKCRSGYDGDGERGCYWNCKLCHPSAICDRENERCICPSGYRGDGQTFCEQIPVRQDSLKVRIMGEGEVMNITDISHPLELRCFVTGSDQSYSGQWIQPHSAQEPIVTKTRQQDGYEISLRINQPTITDSGRYECRAGNVAAFIDVNVEESAIPFTVLLTSDDGILMTQSTDSNVTKATLWNIAENNKYGRVSMVGDCNSQRIIYTSDYGHTIRWGNSNSGQNKLVTKEIYTSQFNRFRNLAVDSLSGNVFAWEEAFGKIMVFNPNKPNIHYTLESLHSLTSSEQQNFAGLALHSTLGLMYWAIYTDGWRPNGTIQVASMSGENEEQLLQLTGEPLAISISPATPVNGNSAGKLCWMQRSSKGMFGLVTELHCARLGQTGREILTNEKIREFSPSEEPSFGMTQYKGTLLWTDASKTVYYSINPDRRIRVRYVCCSNRFQALSVLGDCPQASTNPCTYSNGRCRYICLPNDGGRSRTCVCPDNEPGCHKEM